MIQPFSKDLQEMRFEDLKKILSTPLDELAQHLSEEEQQRYRDTQQSIVDSAVWFHPQPK